MQDLNCLASQSQLVLPKGGWSAGATAFYYDHTIVLLLKVDISSLVWTSEFDMLWTVQIHQVERFVKEQAASFLNKA